MKRPKIVDDSDIKTLEKLLKKITESHERLSEAQDYSKYLYGLETKIPSMTLKTLILLYRVAIGELAHMGEVSPNLLEALRSHVREMLFFVDDPRLEKFLSLVYSDLTVEHLPVDVYKMHLKCFQQILDQVSAEGIAFKDVLEIWDAYTAATQFYIPEIQIEKMKTDLQEVVARLLTPVRRLIKTEVERKYYVDESIKLIEKLKGVKSHVDLHRLLKESRSLLVSLHSLYQESQLPQKKRNERKELVDRLEGTHKTLAIIYYLGATPTSDLYVPLARIVNESPYSQQTVSRHLRDLQNNQLVEKRFIQIPGHGVVSGFKLTEKGKQLLDELKKELEAGVK